MGDSMGKNILILSSSPRKGGNSELLCGRFMEGARQAGHQVEMIALRDKTIQYCIGCEHCLKDPGQCVHKDDMAGILEKMLAAQVMVLATPVYFYCLSAQLKTLIDRTVARYTELKNKEFYFILTAADRDISLMRGAVESLRGFTYCLENAREKGIIYGLGAWKRGEVSGLPAMQEAMAMGEKA